MIQISLSSFITGIVCLGVLSIFLLSGCTISTPFKSRSDIAQVQDEDIVWVGLTRAVRSSNEEKNKLFWSNTNAILDSLKRGDHPGFLGHSVRKEILGKTAWTMTVWKDEASLDAFVSSSVHTKAMHEARSALVDGSFTRVQRPAKDIPLSWTEAEKILTEHSKDYSAHRRNSEYKQ